MPRLSRPASPTTDVEDEQRASARTPTATDAAMSRAKVFRLYLKVAETTASTLCARYSYHDLRRFFQVDSGEEHDVSVHSDDPLATMLSDGFRQLPRNDRGSRAVGRC